MGYNVSAILVPCHQSAVVDCYRNELPSREAWIAPSGESRAIVYDVGTFSDVALCQVAELLASNLQVPVAAITIVASDHISFWVFDDQGTLRVSHSIMDRIGYGELSFLESRGIVSELAELAAFFKLSTDECRSRLGDEDSTAADCFRQLALDSGFHLPLLYYDIVTENIEGDEGYIHVPSCYEGA